MRRLLSMFLALVTGVSVAHGEAPADREPGARVGDRGAARPTDPYARFSDGPRRVPRRRGASLERSRALGIGTTTQLRRVLARPMPDRLRAATPRGGLRTPLHWPVDGGRFGRGFGFVRRTIPDLRHDGIDVVAPRHSVVRAVAPGIVVYSDNGLRGLGNCVVVAHRNGLMSLYAHQERTTVQPGWRVRRGERIGYVGDTGIARGPHLHFELRRHGRLVDPMRWLRAPAPGADEPIARHPDGRIATVAGRPIGDVDATVALLREGLDEVFAGAVGGRTFASWLWPLRGGTLGDGFGDGHRGVDALAPVGAPVRAAADGLVVFVGDGLPGLDRTIVLAHPNGALTLYGNVEDAAVRPGETVLRGNWIARLAGGERPHLHFAVYRGGRPVDPGPDLRGP